MSFDGAPPAGVGHDPDPYVAQLQPWTQKLPTMTRGSMITRSIFALILGGTMAVMVVAVLVIVVIKHPAFTQKEFAVFPATVFAWGYLYTGIRNLRLLPAGSWNDPVQFSAPHAFTLTGGLIRFPGTFSKKAEDWPLDETTVKVIDTRLRKGLYLHCDRFKTRRFPARGLEKSPTQLEQIIIDYRKA